MYRCINTYIHTHLCTHVYTQIHKYILIEETWHRGEATGCAEAVVALPCPPGAFSKR